MNKGTAIVGFFISFLAGMFLMWSMDKRAGGTDIGAETVAAAGGPVPDQSAASVPVSSKDPQWGKPTAPVTIVEISDFECPFCSRVGPTLKSLKEKYGPDKIRIVWKHNPLPFHKSARGAHEAIDAWTPPENLAVYQIAGTGKDTLAGIDYYEQCVLTLCMPRYRPSFIAEGDGVVPVSSALLLPETSNVTSLVLDLSEYGFGLAPDRDHGTMLGIPALHAFIRDVLEGTTTFAEDTLAPFSHTDTRDTFRFFLHSPLTLAVTDTAGHRTGPVDGESSEPHTEAAHEGKVSSAAGAHPESGERSRQVDRILVVVRAESHGIGWRRDASRRALREPDESGNRLDPNRCR